MKATTNMIVNARAMTAATAIDAGPLQLHGRGPPPHVMYLL
jgi:hypothetical protein